MDPLKEKRYKAVIMLLKASHRSVPYHHCFSCDSALHSRRQIACLHLSVPHFNWSILLKYDSERGVSVYHVTQHNVCLCARVQMGACVIMPRHFECHVFWFLSFFLLSFFLWTPYFALLLLTVFPGWISFFFLLYSSSVFSLSVWLYLFEI